MKPPHWLCRKCGFIITDSGNEPDHCIKCQSRDWEYLGYEDEYNLEDIQNEYLTKLRPLY